MHRLLPWFAIFLLVGCSEANGPAISADDAWIREPAPGRDLAAGYVTLTNNTATARSLVAASSDNASSTEIHEMTHEDGMMRMREIDAIALPAGERVRLEPGGLHLMLRNLSPSEAGERIPVTLEFDDGSRLELDFPIRTDSAGGGHGNH